MSEKLTMVKEFPYNKIGSYRLGNPFTIAFVYPRKGNGVIVKGGYNDVKSYIKKEYPVSLVYFNMYGRTNGFHNTAKCRTIIRVFGVPERMNSWGRMRDNYCISIKKSRPSYRAIENIEDEWMSRKAVKGHRCLVRVYESFINQGGASDEKLVFEKELRRLPRCWMKELNPFVKEQV
jgi:hypothetical protein